MHAADRSRIDLAVSAICSVVLWVTTAVIFAILTANTLLRYFAGTSLQWANEVPELLFPWLVMAGVVMAAVHGSHIATVFLVESVPAHIRRVISVVGWLVVALLYTVLSHSTWQLLEIVHDERSPILQVPGSVTYGCVMGGMALLALLALRSAWRSLQSTPETDTDAPQVHV